LLSGDDLLALAAVNAVRQWRYKPTLRGRYDNYRHVLAEELDLIVHVLRQSAGKDKRRAVATIKSEIAAACETDR
jgi:hypothetical protein